MSSSGVARPVPVSGVCSGALTLTGSAQDITGCSVSLTPGNWIVTGTFDMIESGAGDLTNVAIGSLVTTGGAAAIANSASAAIYAYDISAGRNTVTQVWAVAVTATTTAKLQALKTAGSGASTVGVTHTAIVAWYVGP